MECADRLYALCILASVVIVTISASGLSPSLVEKLRKNLKPALTLLLDESCTQLEVQELLPNLAEGAVRVLEQFAEEERLSGGFTKEVLDGIKQQVLTLGTG